MSDEGLKLYLFLPQSKDKLTDSYMAVKQAQIKENIAEKAERVAGYGVIFTTNMKWEEVNDKLKLKKDEQYLLIELNDKISGNFPDTNIERLKSLNLENIKENAEWLEEAMIKAVENQDYEKAAELRDKLKNGNTNGNTKDS